jgi:hypothetical protein
MGLPEAAAHQFRPLRSAEPASADTVAQMDIGWLIIIFAIIAVVFGSVIALVWWHLADVFFPGTSEKTGQRIFRRRRSGPEPPKAIVIDFDAPREQPRAKMP